MPPLINPTSVPPVAATAGQAGSSNLDKAAVMLAAAAVVQPAIKAADRVKTAYKEVSGKDPAVQNSLSSLRVAITNAPAPNDVSQASTALQKELEVAKALANKRLHQQEAVQTSSSQSLVSHVKTR